MTLSRNPLHIRINELELSVRTTNCLHNAGINNVGDLTAQAEHDLMRIKNFGRRCLSEVKEILGTFHLTLRVGPVVSLEDQMSSALGRARAAKQAYAAATADVQRIAALMIDAPIPTTNLEAPLDGE